MIRKYIMTGAVAFEIVRNEPWFKALNWAKE